MNRKLCLALLALAMLSGLDPLWAQNRQGKPNIIFILMDDLGHADLGCTGAKDLRTPHIDRLASEGVRFRTFYANAPVCTPTRAAFITGRYQQRVGLEWAFGFTAEQFRRQEGRWVPETDMYAPGLPPQERYLPALLRRAGYRCGAFGKWHLGFRPEFNPLRHGFDEYFGVLTGHADYYSYKYFDGTYVLRENDKAVAAKGYLTDLLTDKAVDFIKRHQDRPFFLYLPHLAVHFPFQVPDRPDQVLTKENYNDGTRADYVAMVQRVDDGVGRILKALEQARLADNTLIAFSSDNGGYRLSSNQPFFHYKSTLWEGGVRVPCLLRWPARLPQGKLVSQHGITMDLTATFLAAAGAKIPADHQLDGIDLMPMAAGSAPDRPRTFCWRIDRRGRQQKALRQGSWKYLQDGWIEFLFDLDKDVGERHNLAYQHPAELARLRRLLADWEADVGKNQATFLVK